MSSNEDKEYSTVHGNIYSFKGYSLERIVIYVCVTTTVITWLLAR